MKSKLTRLIGVTLIVMTLIMVNFSCKNKSKKDNNKTELTTISYPKEIYDFGELKPGEKVIHTFRIKNTGEHPFVISRINSGCSCTIIKYDKKPLKKGEELKIDVEFDSTSRYGKQLKTIMVYGNVNTGGIPLRFTANIKQ